jgi:hypothetical protein
MRVSRIATSFTVCALALSACDSTEPSLFDNEAVDADIAASAGDAAVLAIESMIANESSAQLAAVGDAQPAVTFARTRACYDANGAVVQNCLPLSSVRRIVTHVEISGSRTGERTTRGGTTATWTGVVHRVSDDTLVRNFNATTEVSRTHTDVATGNDTTTFVDGDFSRTVAEAIIDSVKQVTFNLPRSSNPYPASGSIVRRVNVKVTVASGARTESREFSRRITVAFPPDAQGNVVLTINETTCNLNLVTRRVTACES